MLQLNQHFRQRKLNRELIHECQFYLPRFGTRSQFRVASFQVDMIRVFGCVCVVSSSELFKMIDLLREREMKSLIICYYIHYKVKCVPEKNILGSQQCS